MTTPHLITFHASRFPVTFGVVCFCNRWKEK